MIPIFRSIPALGRGLLTLLAALALPTASGAQSRMSDAEFSAELARHGARFQRVDQQKHQYLAYHGRLAEGLAELDAMVPAAGRTPIDDLILGNMLYPLSPELARPYHLRAWLAYPDQPQAMGPMTMQLQRRGELDSALAIYQKLEALGRLSDVQYALMAQCYIHAGNYEKALDAWARANHEKNHTEIDFAINNVFGGPNPIARHDSLLGAVRAGRTEAIGPLLSLALDWNVDWWNAGINQEVLAVDVETIAATFGASSTEAREARLLADAVTAKLKGRDALERLLKQDRMVIAQGALPENTAIARQLMSMALEMKIVEEEALERWHRAELQIRVRRPQSDKDAIDILRNFARLSDRTKELDELEMMGWHRFGDPDHAFALLTRRLWSGDTTLTSEDPMLVEAMAQFPRDSRFPGIAYKLALDHGTGSRRDIARVIEAEYYALRSDPDRYSNALDALFGNLAEAMKQAKDRDAKARQTQPRGK